MPANRRKLNVKDRLITERMKRPAGFRRRRKIPSVLVSTRDPMFDWIAGCDRLVEVGSQWGWWAHRAARQLPGTKIWCVDPWYTDSESARAWSGSQNMYEWQENVAPWLGNRVFGLHGTSREVARYFKSGEIDCVFIDGDHSASGVALDLKLWTPKVRVGGLIIGHDWDGVWGSTVRPVVRNFFDGLGNVEAEIGYVSTVKESAVWRVKKTWQ